MKKMKILSVAAISLAAILRVALRPGRSSDCPVMTSPFQGRWDHCSDHAGRFDAAALDGLRLKGRDPLIRIQPRGRKRASRL